MSHHVLITLTFFTPSALIPGLLHQRLDRSTPAGKVGGGPRSEVGPVGHPEAENEAVTCVSSCV